jgi:hypothetical protein
LFVLFVPSLSFAIRTLVSSRTIRAIRASTPRLFHEGQCRLGMATATAMIKLFLRDVPVRCGRAGDGEERRRNDDNPSTGASPSCPRIARRVAIRTSSGNQ